MGHPSDDIIQAFVQGTLGEDDAREVHRHLAVCDECRLVVKEEAQSLQPTADLGTGEAAGEVPALLASGTLVSRYAVVRVIGTGGGGVVYEAHDPRLNRPVALKVLRAGTTAPGASAGSRGRFLDEAQAMAQLAHPNVVGVFDAGVYDDQVFIVMELVEGHTLAQWLAAGPRPTGEIIARFAEAGAALGAAHGAGIVHGDFKPENVILGADGRVRVSDFGLARWAGHDDSQEMQVVGTPGYMAPEQFAGRSPDARTDQFNFCVAVFRALFGRHPFAPATVIADLRALSQAVVAGQFRPPADLRDVAPGVVQALVRGLQPLASNRFPSMENLLAALRPVPPPARAVPRRARWMVGAGSIVALAALWAWRGRDQGQTARPAAGTCGDGITQVVEECDDGNTTDGDGCTAACLRCQSPDGAFAWALNGHCYTRQNQGLPWQAARASCQLAGGDLLSYASYTEMQVVGAALFKDGTLEPLWIGLAGNPARGFSWITADPLPPPGPAWAPGEPGRGTAEGSDTCVQQVAIRTPMGNTTWPWSTADCARPLPYVCERSAWVVRPETGHAYKLFLQRLSWDAARADCIRRGAHLVTVSDAGEDQEVRSQAARPVWMGASDKAVEGTFRWDTGEPFGFSAFAPGEPDNLIEADCVAMGPDHAWHDRACSVRYAFMCEID